MGRAWKFGDDVDTDTIIPGRYLVINDPKELARHVFENVRPEFVRKVREGDFIIAGENFGCGSSREHAPLSLKALGVYVVAKSYARIFFRNAINIGLPAFECKHTDDIEDGDNLKLDIDKGIIVNLTKGEEYDLTPIPDFLREIIECGGLIEFCKRVVRC